MARTKSTSNPSQDKERKAASVGEGDTVTDIALVPASEVTVSYFIFPSWEKKG